MNDRVKSFLTRDMLLYVILSITIILYGIVDFYFANVKEKNFYQEELDNINRSTIKQLQKDFLKINTFLEVCNSTKCTGSYKPALSLLPEFILIKIAQPNSFKKELIIDSFTEANTEFISIVQGKYKTIIKTEDIKNKINATVPRHIQYSIYSNKKKIINKEENDEIQRTTSYIRSYQLLNNELTVDYWINQKYIDYKITLLKENIIRSCLIMSIIIIVMSFLLYRSIKYKTYANLTKSLEEISIQKEKIEDKFLYSSERLALVENAKIIDKKLTKYFCKYALLKNESDEEYEESIQELKLREKIIIQDNNQFSLDATELTQEIQIYYADYIKFNNIVFSIESNVDYIQLQLAKESFYQIIFSLIDNKLRLLGRGDQLKVLLDQNKEELIFSMKDNGFSISEKQIQEYTKKITERSNLFFLSWDEVISVLESYGYDYKVKPNNKSNHLQIKFLNSMIHANQNKICYLENYRSRT
jgi:hypothetical protein